MRRSSFTAALICRELLFGPRPLQLLSCDYKAIGSNEIRQGHGDLLQFFR